MRLREASLARLAALREAAPGVLIAIALAALARGMAQGLAHGAGGLPKFPLSPVMCAVVLGMLWRNTIGVPAWASGGLNWAMHRLLRIGIALVGLRLTLGGATTIALTALPVALCCLTVALGAGIGVSRLLEVPRRLGLLLAIGTAVCGCTAVVAMSPVIRARHAETAFAVTCVVLFGCIAMLFYPYLAGHVFGASPVHAGVFLGTAIHDTSQVIGAALIYSQQAAAPAALAAASVAKLLRNLSIAVLIPAAAWLTQRHERAQQRRQQDDDTPAGTADSRPPLVPFFVLGFIALIVVRTAGDALFYAPTPLWQAVVNTGYSASDLFLTCGMTAVGLSVSFTDMWRIGWRP
ncbi:MAG TPA: putative sulfate exporter family transporter, partial [Steroidobacteraceae bacterium]|nr:putative sulfate exporter family transporter [Steroidobacteraceae bacterium]